MKIKISKKAAYESNQKLLPTGTPGLMVKVSQRGTGKKLYLEGHGVDTSTGRIIPGTSIKRKLQTPESMDFVAATVAHLVEQKYLALHRPEKPKAGSVHEGLYNSALKQS